MRKRQFHGVFHCTRTGHPQGEKFNLCNPLLSFLFKKTKKIEDIHKKNSFFYIFGK